MTNEVKAIRKRLGITQQAIADGLGCTQGNVGHYERGQTLPPEMARKLIALAGRRGLAISFDHIYGDKPLPELQDECAAVTHNAASAVRCEELRPDVDWAYLREAPLKKAQQETANG